MGGGKCAPVGPAAEGCANQDRRGARPAGVSHRGAESRPRKRARRSGARGTRATPERRLGRSESAVAVVAAITGLGGAGENFRLPDVSPNRERHIPAHSPGRHHSFATVSSILRIMLAPIVVTA